VIHAEVSLVATRGKSRNSRSRRCEVVSTGHTGLLVWKHDRLKSPIRSSVLASWRVRGMSGDLHRHAWWDPAVEEPCPRDRAPAECSPASAGASPFLVRSGAGAPSVYGWRGRGADRRRDLLVRLELGERRPRFPPVSDTASGMPCPSTMSGACCPAVRGRPGSAVFWAPPGGPHVRGVDHRPLLVQLVLRPQLLQQQHVQLVPDAGLVPGRTGCRQQIMPEPKPSSWDRYSHWMPVCRTKRIPDRACRSGTRGVPSAFFGPGFGSNGSASDHSSSDTIHGRD
jgi:hypothetical protein